MSLILIQTKDVTANNALDDIQHSLSCGSETGQCNASINNINETNKLLDFNTTELS